MSLAYNLDSDMAREGDSIGSNRIMESGGYEGEFTMAKETISRKGTQGVEFSFRGPSGEAKYLTLWTQNKDGEQLYGMSVLNAIMTCLKIRSVNPVNQMINEYDFDAKQNVDKPAVVYPDFMNKPIGIVLQKEEYLNSSGIVKEKFNLFASYEDSTRKTALEILDNKPAERLDKLLATLHDKKLPAVQANQVPEHTGMDAPADFDDDIPF